MVWRFGLYALCALVYIRFIQAPTTLKSPYSLIQQLGCHMNIPTHCCFDAVVSPFAALSATCCFLSPLCRMCGVKRVCKSSVCAPINIFQSLRQPRRLFFSAAIPHTFENFIGVIYVIITYNTCPLKALLKTFSHCMVNSPHHVASFDKVQ